MNSEIYTIYKNIMKLKTKEEIFQYADNLSKIELQIVALLLVQDNKHMEDELSKICNIIDEIPNEHFKIKGELE